MDTALALVAALAATFFAFDLWKNYRARPRPHIAAYAIGMSMFAVATLALVVGLAFGWTGLAYRTFYLFGAVLNIPFLALGSMFLVVGPRAGHIMAVILGAFTAISTTLVATVPFVKPLPTEGIPYEMFESGFGPALFARIGSIGGATILIILAVVSMIRFWNKNRSVAWGSSLILLGALFAAWGGMQLRVGKAETFVLSLLLTVTLIWIGYRVASGKRTAQLAD